MGKLPYIPVYIGDWEQDTNMISLEAEGALIKLMFKLWKAKEKGQLYIGFTNLAILFKKSDEITRKIVSEIHENDVLNVHYLENDRVKFESRRMLDAIAKSLIMSKNGKKGGRGKSKKNADHKLIESQIKAEQKPIPDNDIHISLLSNGNSILEPTINKTTTKVQVSKKNETKKSESNPFELIPKDWPVDVFRLLWDEFVQQRTKRKKPVTGIAIERRIKEIIEVSGGIWKDAQKIMTYTNDKCYDQFYKPEIPKHIAKPGIQPKTKEQIRREIDYKLKNGIINKAEYERLIEKLKSYNEQQGN